MLAGLAGASMAVWPGSAGALAPTHGHLGTVGFFLSMVMGVAYWMLPRPGGIRQTGFEAVTFALLQSGMVLRVVGEPWWRLGGDALPHALFVASGVLTFAATVAFALAMSRRVVTVEAIRAAARPRGSRERPAAHAAGEQGAGDEP
ncbi:MAG TPA: hypothetical protein VFF08_08655 [Trueperaceae bacterium]|nr:hypothetical protein [Trueperaceae bacterium]